MEMNPLYNDFRGRYAEVPFSKIKTEHFEPAIERGVKLAKDEIEAICSNSQTPDFQNTIVAFEKVGKELDRVLNVFYPLNSALSDDDLMEISLKVAPMLSEYSTSITLNEKLWERIRYVYDHREEYNLDGEDKMLLTEIYDSFRRSGALLDEKGREQLKKINAELTELTTVFGQNVLKELKTYKIYLDKDDTEGLPQRIIDQAADEAAKDGQAGRYFFNLSQPVYMAVMKYCKSRDVREKFYKLYTGRNISGEFSNTDIVLRIAELRLEKARLLGYETFADLKLSHTMAKTKANVFNLLDSLADAYRPAQLKEFAELNDFAREKGILPDDMKPWDYSFVANKLKEAKYNCDEELFRPYFPLDSVVKGVFGLAERLYGISFEKVNVDVYHPDVEVYEVKDGDGTYLGLLYTDFFPRDNKRPGAWMTDFGGLRFDDDGKEQRPHVSIVMNFTKPHGNSPSLLSTSEVQTFLHEFGHALHGLLTKTRYASLSGTNVYRDFVELPSQFNENFLTNEEFLKTFARHWQTGE
ncbi:MAG: M3 family metallopeptidase, partial [Paramuribaculum sp.]|nr:M3 family metallopeptidase [Paramuribaculum sp.]